MITASRKIVILQNSREAANPLCSVPFIVSEVEGVTVVPGRVWPSFEAAIGQGETQSRWGSVSRTVGRLPTGVLDVNTLQIAQTFAPYCATYPGREVLLDLAQTSLDGLIVVDGSWSQLQDFIRLNRWIEDIRVLRVQAASTGRVSKQRLSAVGAVAVFLGVLDKRPEYMEQLLGPYRAFLQQQGVADDPMFYQEEK